MSQKNGKICPTEINCKNAGDTYTFLFNALSWTNQKKFAMTKSWITSDIPITCVQN